MKKSSNLLSGIGGVLLGVLFIFKPFLMNQTVYYILGIAFVVMGINDLVSFYLSARIAHLEKKIKGCQDNIDKAIKMTDNNKHIKHGTSFQS